VNDRQDVESLLVIGFDGLDYELLCRHGLPCARLLPLFSPVPVTGPAWTSIYTGDSVGAHKVRDCFGLPGFRRYARNEILHQLLWRARLLVGRLGLREPLEETRTYATTSSTYIWDSLGRAGVTVKLVNLPAVLPVREVNGIHVAGWPLDKRRRWYYPDEIGPTIPEDYAEWSDIIQWYEKPVIDRGKIHREKLRKLGWEGARRKTEATSLELAKLFATLPPASFQMVQFSFIDRLGHVFGIQADAERFCYSLVNRIVELLLEQTSPDSFIVVSDHGFQKREHTDCGALAVGGTIAERLKVPSGYTVDVLDIAPTVAAFYGVGHPAEGNNLLGTEPVAGRKSHDEGERNRVIGRMREIGYF